MLRFILLLILFPLRFLFFWYVKLRSIHRGLVLTITLKGNYSEAPLSHGLWAYLKPSKDRFYLLALDLAAALHAAEQKKIRLKHVRVLLEENDLGWAQAWEIRDLLQQFRQLGIEVSAYLLVSDRTAVFIASAATTTAAPESAAFDFSPFTGESIFLQNLFSKVGVRPQFLSVGDFKSAAEIFTKTKMSPAARKQTEELLSDIETTFVTAIEEKMKKKLAKSERTIQDTASAKKLGFIDQTCSVSEFKDTPETDALRSVDAYELSQIILRKNFRLFNFKKLKRVALVTAEGNIIESAQPRAGTINWADYAEVGETLKENDFAAMLLRVNSPGGSALVSQLLWREWMLSTGNIQSVVESEEKEDEKKKAIPIFVSQGNVAASGGYYLSATANRIFSTPLSITGSIGVVGGKFNVTPLLQKLGVTTDRAPLKNPSPLFSPYSDFSKENKKALEKNMLSIYEQFLRDIAVGRRTTVKSIIPHASGRVFSGQRAQTHALVDNLGGITHTLRALREELKLKPSENIELMILPAIKESLFNRGALPMGLQRLLAWSDFSKFGVYTIEPRFLFL
ncbi:MAG TPA: S49 family peptidase [Turneriella sp.]|nr:S49 family peptidase [Turneriella sp.]